MANQTIDDLTPDALVQFADDAKTFLRFLKRMEGVSALADTLASSKAAIVSTQSRLDKCRGQEDAAKSALSVALVAVEDAKASAGVEAEKIMQSAREAAQALAAKARQDLEEELADTRRALETARQELGGLNDRIAKARNALSA